MKKILITILVVVLIIGAAAVWMLTRNMPVGDEGVEGDVNKVQVQDTEKEYYEAEYPDGNDATTLADLTYSLPEGYTGILSEDDSVVENLYVNTTTGTKLSISKRACESEQECSDLGNVYLEGASDIKDFDVNGYEAHQYKDLIGDTTTVADCCFYIIKGSDLYYGLLWHPESEEKTDDGEEPDPIPLTEEEIQSFQTIIDSLALQ